jgi:hypothetical protein
MLANNDPRYTTSPSEAVWGVFLLNMLDWGDYRRQLMTGKGKTKKVDRIYLNFRLDCHYLEDINHIGADLERCIRRHCADRFEETVWMVILQSGEV